MNQAAPPCSTIYRTHPASLSYNVSIMFCPNCSAQNEETQHYCRMCGLQLDAIAANLTVQRPSPKMAVLLKRKRRAQMLGVVSLSTAGVIGLMLLLSQAFYYKLLLLGPELLFGSAFVAVILFLLASVFFFNYPRLFIKIERPNAGFSESGETAPQTNKLLGDPPFEPASVTEHSTELLHRNSRKADDKRTV